MRNLLLLFLSLAQFCAAEYRIFWVDIWNSGIRTQAQADAMLAAAAQSKANAVFLQVRGEGHAFYLKRIEPLPPPGWTYQTGFDAISYITDKCHTLGLEVHAWMDLTPLWNPDRGYNPADPTHKWHAHGRHITGSELWMTATEKSNYMHGIVDLGHPGAAKHVANVIVDSLRHYNLDGIQLDYIRYPYAVDRTSDGIWNPEFYGWNPTSIERFNRLNGRSGVPVQADSAWQNWRRAQITNVVRQVYLRAKEIRPSAKVSAAVTVWGAPPAGENFQTTEPYQVGFQDWHSWLQEGIIDFVMPMLYRNEADAASKANFDAWLNWFAQHKHGREIVPGIGNYMNTVSNTLAQVDRVIAHPGNFAGFGLFSYASTNKEGISNSSFYSTLGSRWEAAPVPALSWITQPTNANVLGQLTSSDGVLSKVDGVTVELRRATDHAVVKSTTSDGAGFFGMQGIAPGAYYVAWKRNTVEILRSNAKAVYAGESARFDAVLSTACVYSLSRKSVTMSAEGGTTWVTVTASDDSCQWVAGVGFSWGLALNGPTARTGSAVLQYTFAPNLGAARSGYVRMGDTSIPFLQLSATVTSTAPAQSSPPDCTYTYNPKTVLKSAAGGNATVTVTASQPTCQWTAGSGFSWGLTLDGPTSRTGSAVLEYTFAPNTGSTRSGYVRMGDSSVQFIQFGP